MRKLELVLDIYANFVDHALGKLVQLLKGSTRTNAIYSKLTVMNGSGNIGFTPLHRGFECNLVLAGKPAQRAVICADRSEISSGNELDTDLTDIRRVCNPLGNAKDSGHAAAIRCGHQIRAVSAKQPDGRAEDPSFAASAKPEVSGVES